jgi:hypothetical protein
MLLCPGLAFNVYDNASKSTKPKTQTDGNMVIEEIPLN